MGCWFARRASPYSGTIPPFVAGGSGEVLAAVGWRWAGARAPALQRRFATLMGPGELPRPRDHGLRDDVEQLNTGELR